MNLRIATINDTEAILQFATDWIIYSFLCNGFEFDHDIFSKHIAELIAGKNMLVVMGNTEEDSKIVGAIGGRIVESFYSKDIIFDVVSFYIDPEYRHLTGEVLQDLENILSMTTVTKLVVSNPSFQDSAKHHRYYKMKGYRDLQMNLIKDIKRPEAPCQPA